MNRELNPLDNKTFDLVVVGGGITGAFTALEASRRGLKVALIEKSDFGAGTSANSLKVIHCGFRRLKKGDLWGVLKGLKDRQEYFKLVPHLVRPLPVVVPLYGNKWIQRLKGFFATGIFNGLSLLFPIPNTFSGEHRSSTFIDVDTTLQYVPVAPREQLAGGILFYDAQATHTERLTLAVVQMAQSCGAIALNYLEAESFQLEKNKVIGVVVKDSMSGRIFSIKTHSVVMATGPWRAIAPFPVSLLRAFNLVVARQWSSYAFALPINKRNYFFSPWRGATLIGTHQRWSGPFKESEEAHQESEIFREELNAAFPQLRISQQDIVWTHSGWVPAQNTESSDGEAMLAEAPILYDHSHSKEGLGCLSLVGVKYTGAPRLARHAVGWVESYLQRTPRYAGGNTPSGGANGRKSSISKAIHTYPNVLEKLLQRLIETYGIYFEDVIRVGLESSQGLEPLGSDIDITPAEIIYAIRSEMAVTLADIVFRRTYLGAMGCPPVEMLELVAAVASKEAGWSSQETSREIQSVLAYQHRQIAVA